MSFIAHLIRTAARAGIAGAEVHAKTQMEQAYLPKAKGGQGKRRKKKADCTPCAAIERANRARAMGRASGDG